MFVDYRGSILGVVRWQWKDFGLFAVWATIVVVGSRVFDLKALELPALPISVAGAAIGIFVSFRTNAAYDRWWEGRKIWGRLVNTSRHIATQAMSYLATDHPLEAEAIVRRQVAYVHALRCANRLQPELDDEILRPLLEQALSIELALEANGNSDAAAELEEALQSLRSESNLEHALLHRHLVQVTRLANDEVLDEYQRQSLDESVRHLLDIQGMSERIKKTPFPGFYGFIAKRLIHLFAILLPLALVAELGWITIPATIIVCSAFQVISETGRVLEDPFTMFWPALPLSALSSTIEANLRQRLGDTDLPVAAVPDGNGVLM